MHSGDLGIGRLGLSCAVNRLHLVCWLFCLGGPVHIHLNAKNDVEDQCHCNTGRHDLVVDLGGGCEQTCEAACDLGNDSNG